jgi:transposase
MVRALKIAKQTAIKARTQAVNAVKGLIVMAPDPIREQLRHLSTPNLVRTCSAYRVDGASDPASATKLSLRSLRRRYIVLDQEVRSLEKELDTPHAKPQTTKAYFTKRTAEGKSKKEIFRCLKRYVARGVYTTLIDRPQETSRSAA